MAGLVHKNTFKLAMSREIIYRNDGGLWQPVLHSTAPGEEENRLPRPQSRRCVHGFTLIMCSSYVVYGSECASSTL